MFNAGALFSEELMWAVLFFKELLGDREEDLHDQQSHYFRSVMRKHIHTHTKRENDISGRNGVCLYLVFSPFLVTMGDFKNTLFDVSLYIFIPVNLILIKIGGRMRKNLKIISRIKNKIMPRHLSWSSTIYVKMLSSLISLLKTNTHLIALFKHTYILYKISVVSCLNFSTGWNETLHFSVFFCCK